MTIPPKYRKSPESVISFDFADSLRGQSYIQFHGAIVSPPSTLQTGLETGDDADHNIVGADDWFAQTFQVPTTMWIDNVEFFGRSFETGIKCYIQAVDGSNHPTGPKLAQLIKRSGTGNGATNDWWVFDVNGSIKLDAGTTYALVCDPEETGTAFQRVDSSSPSYTEGNFVTSANNGSTWTTVSGSDALFRINGSTTNPNILFPQAIETVGRVQIPIIDDSSDVDVDQSDREFDLLVGKSAILKGVAILETTIVGKEQTDQGMDTTTTIKLQKVQGGPGGTITTIATFIGDRKEGFWTSTEKSFRLNIQFDITTQISLRPGDLLRLKYETVAATDLAQPNVFLAIECDPEDTANDKDLTLYLPFKNN